MAGARFLKMQGLGFTHDIEGDQGLYCPRCWCYLGILRALWVPSQALGRIIGPLIVVGEATAACISGALLHVARLPLRNLFITATLYFDNFFFHCIIPSCSFPFYVTLS